MRQSMLSREHHGPRAVLNAIERLAGSYDGQIAAVSRDLAVAEGQLRDFEARVGRAFPLDEHLSRLAALRDLLKAGLSGTAQESESAVPTDVAVIAEQIKALRATHAIEGPAERIGKRRLVAIEPVTARIRRLRTELPADVGPALEPSTVLSAGEATRAELGHEQPITTSSMSR